jgi:hypothetical protein
MGMPTPMIILVRRCPCNKIHQCWGSVQCCLQSIGGHGGFSRGLEISPRSQAFDPEEPP